MDEEVRALLLVGVPFPPPTRRNERVSRIIARNSDRCRPPCIAGAITPVPDMISSAFSLVVAAGSLLVLLVLFLVVYFFDIFTIFTPSPHLRINYTPVVAAGRGGAAPRVTRSNELLACSFVEAKT